MEYMQLLSGKKLMHYYMLVVQNQSSLRFYDNIYDEAKLVNKINSALIIVEDNLLYREDDIALSSATGGEEMMK